MDDELEERDGLFYRPGDDVPFSGTLKNFWESGDLKSVCQIENGKLYGEHKIYWDNGQLSFYICYKDGVPHGHNYGFWKDGGKWFSHYLNDGKRVGQSEVFR